MDKEQVLEKIEQKFCQLPKELKTDWLNNSKLCHFKKGDVLVRVGERSSKLWFVAKGIVRAHYLKEGKRICDWFAFENQFICELSSFYKDEVSLHQIDLLSDAILFETNKSAIPLLSAHIAFERIGRLSATETMMRLLDRVVSLQFETAEQKLESLLKQHPDIYQLVPLGDIASYIGIAPETLSRLRANKTRI